jgi:hypothetical protein
VAEVLASADAALLVEERGVLAAEAVASAEGSGVLAADVVALADAELLAAGKPVLDSAVDLELDGERDRDCDGDSVPLLEAGGLAEGLAAAALAL